MPPAVREMALDEVDLIIDYFHDSTPEFLDTLGVDPSRMPDRRSWRALYAAELDKPVEERGVVMVIWEQDGEPVGFSTADKISFGEQANMHLHMPDPSRRASGVGTECVRKSADLYFDLLDLQRLFSEPNAFNVAPNRTLQSAGFRYVQTHTTVPGWINYRQPVTRWVLER